MKEDKARDVLREMLIELSRAKPQSEPARQRVNALRLAVKVLTLKRRAWWHREKKTSGRKGAAGI